MSRRMAQPSLLLMLAAVLALPALISPTARAQATSTTTNLSVPTNIVVFVPCAAGGAGEFVLLSGDLHILTHTTVNRKHVTLKTHFQPQGISGTGLTTGDTYHATGVTQETRTFQTDGAPFVDTFVNNFRIIGQGPGNNFLVHQLVHITVNNNGGVTAEQVNTTVDCK